MSNFIYCETCKKSVDHTEKDDHDCHKLENKAKDPKTRRDLK